MEYIYGGRSSGKTRKLFELARKTNSIILTSNKRALKRKAKDLGFSDLTFVELSELKDTPLGQKVVIDEAITLFKAYAESAWSIQIEGLNFTVEDK